MIEPKGKARKIVLPADSVGPTVTLGCGFPERWKEIRANIPVELPPEREEALKETIFKSCNLYLEAARLREAGAATARAVTKPAGKQLAPLESFAKHLLAASAVWPSIRGLQDDRLG